MKQNDLLAMTQQHIYSKRDHPDNTMQRKQVAQQQFGCSDERHVTAAPLLSISYWAGLVEDDTPPLADHGAAVTCQPSGSLLVPHSALAHIKVQTQDWTAPGLMDLFPLCNSWSYSKF